MAIYTTFGKQKTIREFIRKLYSLPYANDTLGRNCVTTYRDEKCYIIQCHQEKLRSFDDIFECVKTYYKNITPKSLFHILLTMNMQNATGKKFYLHMSNCGSIRKIRFLYYHDLTNCLFNFKCNKYDSKYSWTDLLDMLNLKTEKDIKNYIKQYEKI